MAEGPSESVIERIEGFAQTHHESGYEQGYIEGYRRTKRTLTRRTLGALFVGILFGGVAIVAAARAGLVGFGDSPPPDPKELGVERGARFKAAVDFAKEYTVGVSALEHPRRTFSGRNYSPEHLGSGFIFDAQGHIVTNEHVVRDGSKFRVIWKDRAYDAELIGYSRAVDVAVLKINVSDMPAASMAGVEDAIFQSEEVLAIGSPHGLHYTVTSGIISHVGRQFSPDGTNVTVPYIQTDAAINRGNSGGPLINLQGRVVGMNTWQITDSGDSSGIGFAIPIEWVKSAASEIIEKYGSSETPSTTMDEGTPLEQAYLGVLTGEVHKKGIEIVQVYPNTVAAQAGLQPGDLIQAIDGQPALNVHNLVSYIQSRRPGDAVEVRILRSGAPMTVTIRLGRRPSEGG